MKWCTICSVLLILSSIGMLILFFMIRARVQDIDSLNTLFLHICIATSAIGVVFPIKRDEQNEGKQEYNFVVITIILLCLAGNSWNIYAQNDLKSRSGIDDETRRLIVSSLSLSALNLVLIVSRVFFELFPAISVSSPYRTRSESITYLPVPPLRPDQSVPRPSPVD